MLPCKVRLMLGGFILNLKRKKKALWIVFFAFSSHLGCNLFFSLKIVHSQMLMILQIHSQRLSVPENLNFLPYLSVFLGELRAHTVVYLHQEIAGNKVCCVNFFFVHRIITLVYCLLYTEAWITNSSKMYHMKFCFTYLET